jgi:hypothetical protein
VAYRPSPELSVWKESGSVRNRFLVHWLGALGLTQRSDVRVNGPRCSRVNYFLPGPVVVVVPQFLQVVLSGLPGFSDVVVVVRPATSQFVVQTLLLLPRKVCVVVSRFPAERLSSWMSVSVGGSARATAVIVPRARAETNKIPFILFSLVRDLCRFDSIDLNALLWRTPP